MPYRRQRQEVQPNQQRQTAQVDLDDVPFVSAAAAAGCVEHCTPPAFAVALAKLLVALNNIDDANTIDPAALADPELIRMVPMLFLECRRQVAIPEITSAEISNAFKLATAQQHAPDFNVPVLLRRYLVDTTLMPPRTEPFFPGLVRTIFQYYAFVKQHSAEEAWAWEDVEYVTYRPVSLTRSQAQRSRFAAQQSAADRNPGDPASHETTDVEHNPRNEQHLLVCVYRTRPCVPKEYRLTAVPWCHVRQRELAPCTYANAGTQCDDSDIDQPLSDDDESDEE